MLQRLPQGVALEQPIANQRATYAGSGMEEPQPAVTV